MCDVLVWVASSGIRVGIFVDLFCVWGCFSKWLLKSHRQRFVLDDGRSVSRLPTGIAKGRGRWGGGRPSMEWATEWSSGDRAKGFCGSPGEWWWWWWRQRRRWIVSRVLCGWQSIVLLVLAMTLLCFGVSDCCFPRLLPPSAALSSFRNVFATRDLNCNWFWTSSHILWTVWIKFDDWEGAVRDRLP